MVSTASSLLVGKLRQGAGKSPAWQCQPARKRSGSSAGVIALVRECCPWEENMRTLLNVIHVVVFWKFPTPCKIVKIVGFFRKKEASLSQRIVLGVQKCLFLQKKKHSLQLMGFGIAPTGQFFLRFHIWFMYVISFSSCYNSPS